MDLRLDNARISFANGLWNASSAVPTSPPKYNCDFIVTDDTKVLMKTADGKWAPTTLQKAQEAVALEAHKGNAKAAKAWLDKLSANQRSIREGNDNTDKAGEVRAGYADSQYVHATSKTRMPVYRADRSVVESEADSPIYSGCYVNARVSLYAQLTPGKIGLFVSLQGTQFAKNGDAFGGGRAAGSDDFDEVEGADAEDFA
jgi:hypothetical protein